jgi:hypothetical protein
MVRSQAPAPAGDTPMGMRVTAGRHEVVLENPQLRRREVVEVTVAAGQTVAVHREWK